MIKLIRGDSATRLVELKLPDGVIQPGAQLEFILPELVLTVPATARIELNFPATWTKAQSPGRILATICYISPKGERTTISNTFPLYLTDVVTSSDQPGASDATITPILGFGDIEYLDPDASPGDTKSVVNEILTRLKTGVSVACLAFALLATQAATIDKAPLDTIPGNATIVTNVTFEGLATTTSVSTAYRDALVAATNTASQGWSEWSFRAEIWTDYEPGPSVPFEEAFPTSTISISYDPPVDDMDGMWSIFFNGEMWGDQYGDENESYVATGLNPVPGRGYVLFTAERKRIKKDALGLINAPMATNIARSVVNTVWDAALGVAWEARMHNGALYYVAVTNQPPEVK